MSTRTEWQPSPELWERLKPLARQMRAEPTAAEHKLWQHLRRDQIKGVRFRRQYAIERFIVDFCCPSARLIVEVDGPVHDYTADADAVRQSFLESLGFQVLRFQNPEVMNHIDTIVARIAQAVEQRLSG